MALPQTMKQVRFSGPGGPEVIEIETALPQPGPGQVLIAVAAAGINRPDCLQRAGGYPPPPVRRRFPVSRFPAGSSRSAMASPPTASARRSARW